MECKGCCNSDTECTASPVDSTCRSSEGLDTVQTGSGHGCQVTSHEASSMVVETVTTTASEGRKSSKPIMEKRRRARINACLAELKSLLMEVIKSEGARHSKMEKADILEMTVRHLRQLQRHHVTGGRSGDVATGNKYRLGYNECINEVGRFLSSLDIEDIELKSSILEHLANCASGGVFSEPETKVHSTSRWLPPIASLSATRVAKDADDVPTVSHNNGSSTVGLSSLGRSNVTSSTSLPLRILPGKPESSVYIQNPKDPPLAKTWTVTSTFPSTDTSTRKSGPFVQGETNIAPVTSVLPVGSSSLPLSSGGVAGLCLQSTVPPAVSLSSQVTSSAMFGGLQLIPTKLSTGELAFVLPTNMVQSTPAPSYIIPVYTPNIITGTGNTASPVTQYIPPVQSVFPLTEVKSVDVTNFSPTTSGALPIALGTPQKPLQPTSTHVAQANQVVQSPTTATVQRKPEATSPLVPLATTPAVQKQEDTGGPALPPAADTEGEVWRPWKHE